MSTGYSATYTLPSKGCGLNRKPKMYLRSSEIILKSALSAGLNMSPLNSYSRNCSFFPNQAFLWLLVLLPKVFRTLFGTYPLRFRNLVPTSCAKPLILLSVLLWIQENESKNKNLSHYYSPLSSVKRAHFFPIANIFELTNGYKNQLRKNWINYTQIILYQLASNFFWVQKNGFINSEFSWVQKIELKIFTSWFRNWLFVEKNGFR